MCPKLVLNSTFTEVYVIFHEIKIKVYTHYCYLQVYDIPNDLEVEFHVFVHIFMHIAEISKFYDELKMLILSSMNFKMF